MSDEQEDLLGTENPHSVISLWDLFNQLNKLGRAFVRLEGKVEQAQIGLNDLKLTFGLATVKLDEVVQRVGIIETQLRPILENRSNQSRAQTDVSVGMKLTMLSAGLIFLSSLVILVITKVVT